VDIMRAVGLEPDGFLGHSVGELGCSYMDGCFTAEQVVLAAYYLGHAALETELTKGLMVSVGKSCSFRYISQKYLSFFVIHLLVVTGCRMNRFCVYGLLGSHLIIQTGCPVIVCGYCQKCWNVIII